MSPTTRFPLQREDWQTILGLVLAAFFVRAVWHGIALGADWPDTATYLSAGQAIFRTGFIDSPVTMPLYPVLIAGLGPAMIIWFQIALSALTVGLIYGLSLELSASRFTAMAAGIGVCFYPLLIFYANMRLSETTYVFLILSVFYSFYRGHFLLGSIVLVLSILDRPSIDLLAPVLVVAFCIARNELSWRIVIGRLFLYGAVYIVLMSPWWWHNWLLYGTFVRLDLGAGTFMILENNDLFDKVGLNFEALAPAWKAFDVITDPVARDAAMKAAAVGYIEMHPLHWLWRCVERFCRFWMPVPGSDSLIVNTIALLSTLPVFALALLAVIRFRRREWMRFLPVLLPILYLTLVHSSMHAVARYRLPLDPLLILLASGSVAGLATACGFPFSKPSLPAQLTE